MCAIPTIVDDPRGRSTRGERDANKKSYRHVLLFFGIWLSCLALCATSDDSHSEQTLCFAVLADPRNHGDTWKNALRELRDRTSIKGATFAPVEFIVVGGDMDPLAARYEDYVGVFTNRDSRPLFLPVIGNHEFEDGGEHFRYARDVLIPSIPGAVRRHEQSCDYYLDRRNVRIIVVDGYTELGKDGIINDEGRRWVEQVIKEAPDAIEHIFISFHEPLFPRFRHVGESFDEKPDFRNSFWRMLIDHREKVRAVLVGHTHFYYRMRVLDPEGTAAKDSKSFPDEEGGLWQIDAGAAGNARVNTVVLIYIKGKEVVCRVLQAESGAEKPFRQVDEWSIVPSSGAPSRSGGR